MSLLSHSPSSLKSWKTGEVLEDWRKSSVTPVFIKSKKEYLGNHRLVNNPSVLGKMMEQHIPEIVIIKQVEEKKVIRSSQH